ncbi:MAG: hypothetical protein Q4G40_03350 [Brachybacterium sp.]|nr:hypothetical protein [Brachybacterium sp.]
MTFLGADTDQLRGHGTTTDGQAQLLEDLRGRVAAQLAGITWTGPDAADFHAGWAHCSAQWTQSTAAITAFSSQLQQQAEEQDIASDVEGGTSAGPVPSDDDLAPLSYTNPADGGPGGTFDHDPDSEASRYIEVEDEHGNTLRITTQDGAVTVALTDKDKIELSHETGDGSLSIVQEFGDTYTVRVNEDGSATYTFDTFVSAEGALTGTSRYADIELSAGETVDASYAVTVPAGTSLGDALRISPYDPSSIPPGGEITVGASVEQTSGITATGKYKGIEIGAIGAEGLHAESTSTVMARSEDGALSITSGPSSELGIDSTLRFGPESVNATFTSAYRTEESRLQYAEFADSPAGNDAYLDAVLSREFPSDTGGGITDAYQETRTTSSMNQDNSITIGDFSAGTERNDHADELIVRTYPDGHREWAQQILPHGEHDGNWLVVEGGTGRNNDYSLGVTPQNGPGEAPALESYYGRPYEGGEVTLEFSHDEVAQMRDNYATAPFGNTYASETDYLAARIALHGSGDVEMFAGDLYNHYNYRATEDGSYVLVGDTERMPGTWVD